MKQLFSFLKRILFFFVLNCIVEIAFTTFSYKLIDVNLRCIRMYEGPPALYMKLLSKSWSWHAQTYTSASEEEAWRKTCRFLLPERAFFAQREKKGRERKRDVHEQPVKSRTRPTARLPVLISYYRIIDAGFRIQTIRARRLRESVESLVRHMQIHIGLARFGIQRY